MGCRSNAVYDLLHRRHPLRESGKVAEKRKRYDRSRHREMAVHIYTMIKAHLLRFCSFCDEVFVLVLVCLFVLRKAYAFSGVFVSEGNQLTFLRVCFHFMLLLSLTVHAYPHVFVFFLYLVRWYALIFHFGDA